MRVRLRVACERDLDGEAVFGAVNQSLLFKPAFSLQLHLEAQRETCNL